ncbi:MAG: hypothetical protein APF80_09725 [Alphaproteobacteria bacterium BRH_c36]|nr:MAG: hypothetical protein APF80_09725 [Alphaproteobacteria bacterium BRH_c36]
MTDAPADDIQDASGYTVRYGKEKGQFRVFILAGAGILLCIAAFYQGSEILLGIGIAALGAAYYFFPLIESDRPRLGANQYGIFIEGLGLIGWRSVENIETVHIAVRTMMTHELQIKLSQPLEQALLADWRKMAFYRLLMRLPWTMSHNNTIRINLEPFDDPPDEVERTLKRMQRHYRS